jgi:hypothetical protein
MPLELHLSLPKLPLAGALTLRRLRGAPIAQHLRRTLPRVLEILPKLQWMQAYKGAPPATEANENPKEGGRGTYPRDRVQACTRGEKMLSRKRRTEERRISKNSVGATTSIPTQDLKEIGAAHTQIGAQSCGHFTELAAAVCPLRTGPVAVTSWLRRARPGATWSASQDLTELVVTNSYIGRGTMLQHGRQAFRGAGS